MTTTLRHDDLARIAAENHVQLNEYREAGHERGTGRPHHDFTIRPAVGDETYRKASPRDGRRIWAVCWHGHFAFMSALLEEDPQARIRSAVADWRGREDFHRRAPDTRWDNVGSIMYCALVERCSISQIVHKIRPAYADDACAGNHGDEWRWVGMVDSTSSASRQHYIDTGRYLRPGEAIEA